MKRTRRSARQITGAAVAAPAILKAGDALASSGVVKVFAWQDDIQPDIAKKFEADTGITLDLTTIGSNDEAESTVRANGGTGFDVVFPSITNSTNYIDADGNSLFMPVPDTANMDALIPSFLRDSAAPGGTHAGVQILLPFDRGTEGVTLDRGRLDIADTDLSHRNLLWPETEGAAAFRQKSVTMGVGPHLDAIGRVPSNRMLDVYRSEDDTRRVWGERTKDILEHKASFGAFWNNAT